MRKIFSKYTAAAVFFGYLLIAGLLLRELLSGGTPGLIYDWGYRLLPGAGDWSLTSMWNPANSGGTDLYRTSFYFDLIYRAALGLGITGTNFFVVISLLLSALCGYSMYLLVRSYKLGAVAGVLSGLFYQTSTLLLIRLTAGYYGFLISAAFFPLLIYFYAQAVHYWQSTKIPTAKAVFVSLFTFCQIHFLAFFAAVVAVQAVLSLRTDSFRQALRKAGVGVLILIGFGAANLFWILPSSGSAQNAVTASGFTEQAFVTRIESLPHVFWNFLFLTDHGITEDIMVAVNGWWPRGLLLALLMVAGGLLAWRYKPAREQVLFAIWLVILVLPLSTATSEPFGRAYTSLFTHIPLLKLFREVYHLQYLLLFAYSIVLACATQYLYLASASWRRSYRALLLLGGMTAVFLFNAPAWVNLFGYWGTAEVPKGASAANDFLNENTAGRIFYPPNLGFWQLRTEERMGANYPDQLAYSFDRLPVSQASSDLDTRRSVWRLRNAATQSFVTGDSRLATKLRLLNSDTVVVRDDVQSLYWRAVELQKRRGSLIDRWIGTQPKDQMNRLTDFRNVYDRDGFSIYQSDTKAQEIYLADSVQLLCSLRELGPSTSAFISDQTSPLSKYATDTCTPQPENIALRGAIVIDPTQAKGLAHTASLGWSPGFLSFYEDPIFTDTLFEFIYTRVPSSTTLPIGNTVAPAQVVYMVSPQGGELRVGETVYQTYSEQYAWRTAVLATSGESVTVESIRGENAFAGAFNATQQPERPQLLLSSNTELTVEHVSQTKYLVTIPQSSENDRLLVFLQNFDGRWQLRQGDVVISPEQINSYANAFAIPGALSGEFELLFAPQANYTLLIAISGLIAVLIVGFAFTRPLLALVRRKQAGQPTERV